MFRDVIADETDLRALLGTPSEVAVKKQLATLDAHCRAIIARHADLLATLAVADKIPSLAIGVEVEEVFIHCAKAFKRSGLWEPARWPDVSGLTPTAKMFHDQVAIAGMSVEDFARRLETGYRTGLY